VIRLMRAYLNAGIMDGGVVVERHQGTPQGGPLSPLLANVLLDEVDAGARGGFARYADDCNVYVRSAARPRVMAGSGSCTALQLQVNEAKSAVAAPSAASSWATPVGGQGRKSSARWPARRWQLQGPHPATDPPLGRAQHGGWCSGCGLTCWAGRRTSGWRKPRGLARAGRMDASPAAGDPAQALEAAGDDLPGTRRWALDDVPRRWPQQPPLVA
jgi:hypothetical protein